MFICYAVVGPSNWWWWSSSLSSANCKLLLQLELLQRDFVHVVLYCMRLPLQLPLATSQQVSSNTSISISSFSCRGAAGVVFKCDRPGPGRWGTLQVAAGSPHANCFGHNVLILFAFDYFLPFHCMAWTQLALYLNISYDQSSRKLLRISWAAVRGIRPRSGHCCCCVGLASCPKCVTCVRKSQWHTELKTFCNTTGQVASVG